MSIHERWNVGSRYLIVGLRDSWHEYKFKGGPFCTFSLQLWQLRVEFGLLRWL